MNYTTGTLSSENYFLTANAPEGFPIATYEFFGPLTSETWRGVSTAFGGWVSQAGTGTAPPWRFQGQIELPGSDATVWSGSTQLQLRQPLSLNRWRVYDPRVGQYLQPEPILALGSTILGHAFAYALVNPANFIDLDGREIGLLGGVGVGAGVVGSGAVLVLIGVVVVVVVVGGAIWWINSGAPVPWDEGFPSPDGGGDASGDPTPGGADGAEGEGEDECTDSPAPSPDDHDWDRCRLTNSQPLPGGYRDGTGISCSYQCPVHSSMGGIGALVTCSGGLCPSNLGQALREGCTRSRR
jgi:RHS repeat-associated protein